MQRTVSLSEDDASIQSQPQQPLPTYEVRTMLYFAEKLWTRPTGLSPAKLARTRLTALTLLPGKA